MLANPFVDTKKSLPSPWFGADGGAEEVAGKRECGEMVCLWWVNPKSVIRFQFLLVFVSSRLRQSL